MNNIYLMNIERQNMLNSISLKRDKRYKNKMKSLNKVETKTISTQTEKIKNIIELTEETIEIIKIKDEKKVNLNDNIYKLKLFQTLLENNKLQFNNYDNFNKNRINKINNNSFNINKESKFSLFILDEFSIVLKINIKNSKLNYKIGNREETIEYCNNFKIKIEKEKNFLKIFFLDKELLLKKSNYIYIR